MLAFASKKPVMTACATIGKYLLDSDSECSRPYDPNDTDHGTYCRQESARPLKEKAIVLDAREPHIVKCECYAIAQSFISDDVCQPVLRLFCFS